MIAFECSSCGKPLKVKDELAGKKVKCPGCQKPVVVPQPAASLSPPPAAPAEERTLPTSPPSGDEGRTVPPKERGHVGKKESISDAGGLTELGAGQAEFTQAFPAERPSSELTDFLAPAQAPDEIGRLGGFRILKILGHGGMGVVFQGEDPKLRRKVAIKAMLPHLAGSKSSQERFLREARAAATLEHDHIVPIFHVGEDRGAPFIVMPFLQGEPLDERLKKNKILPLAEVLRIGRETTKGLAAAHKRGLIHRDIKPANLWLEGEEGRVKILDFGLARAAVEDSHLTESGAIVGTPAYMAPEQAGGEKVDHRCDLFSLGCVLYRLCTGTMPFKGKDSISTLVAVATENPPPPVSINPELPMQLSDLVMQLLAKEPEKRPESAQTVVEAIQEIEKQTSDTTARPGHNTQKVKVAGKTRIEAARTRTAPSAKRRLPLLWQVGGGVLGLSVLGLLLFLLLRPGSNPTSQERERPENKELPKEITNSLGMKFMLIPAGKFTMGSSQKEIDRCLKMVENGSVEDVKSEGPEHEVEITRPLYMGETEVTVGQFRQFVNESNYRMNNNRWQTPGWAQTDDHAVVWLSWHNAVDFCLWLSRKEGKQYRLPSEAEWEYCCRAGKSRARYWFGDDDAQLENFDWYDKNSGGRPYPVGMKKPNEWGLYDMHGNVREWCQDVYDPNYYKTSPRQDPRGPDTGAKRVLRGGSWNRNSVDCRSATRAALSLGTYSHASGFRVVLLSSPGGTPPPPEEKKTATRPPKFKNNLGMEFVLVPKGRSWLGGGGGKPGDKEVEIKEEFYLGKFEVTQGEWEKVMGSNPSAFKKVEGVPKEDLKRFPVEDVSWDETHEFMKVLNEKAKEAGWVYRLPKEVEWEYACRGGPMTDKGESAFDFYFDKLSNQVLPDQANIPPGKDLRRTCMVGSYRPNRLGLYDMHGNVWEWCDDAQKSADGSSHRVFRGGSWNDHADNCRAATSYAAPPSHRIAMLGLRLARIPAGKEIVRIPAEEKKPTTFTNSLGMEFVPVPKGKSWLGGGGGNPGDTEVEVKEDFYLGKYEVTQEEWEKITGTNAGRYSRAALADQPVPGVTDADAKRFPVQLVSWEDAQGFIERLNQRAQETGWVYRLPTEVEWEYACRGGPLADRSESAFDYYLEKPMRQLLREQANFSYPNSLKRPRKVGSYAPNRLGLHDMHGNVDEMCHDTRIDTDGKMRCVLRGGGAFDDRSFCRAANRRLEPTGAKFINLGLRVARVPTGKESK